MDRKSEIKERPQVYRRRTDIDRGNGVVSAGEDEFRMAIDTGGLGILDYHPLSGEMQMSSTAKEHFGLSPETKVNYNVFLVGLHPEDRKPAVRLLQSALEGEKNGKLIMEFRTIGIEDGKERRIAASGRTFFNQWGEAVRLLGLTRDITGRMQAEKELQASEERFRGMADAMPQLVWTAEPDGTVYYYNKRVAEFAGFERRADGSWLWSPVLHPDDAERTVQAWQRAVKTGERYEIEHQVRRIDGSYRWFLSRAEPVRDAAGRVVKWYGTTTNIDELKRAQAALQESEEHYRLLFDRSPIPKWVIDLETLAIREVNNAAVEHYGYSREEFRELSIADIQASDDFENSRQWTREFPAREKQDERRIRTKHLTKSKKVIDVEVRYVGIMHQNRKAALGSIIDFTELRQAEEERERLIDELQRSNKELQQFAYAASHDLQEPLRSVASYVELLQERYQGKLDERAVKYISFAADGAHRMSALIKGLLAYSRIETQGRPLKSVDMNAVFRQVEANLSKAISDSRGAVTSDALPAVQGDDTQLAQLLQNLIANGLKFRKQDVPPSVNITAERRRHEWVFGVHDNGIGIEPRFFDRVFMIFQRLHTTEEYPGTGVGLAISRRIVERHCGRMWVQSTPGKGSSFYFSIPCGEARCKKGKHEATPRTF